MNNVNIDFNFKYPSKKERVIYTVTSVLKDEIRLFGKSVISAILVCVCFENGWILPQEHCDNYVSKRFCGISGTGGSCY